MRISESVVVPTSPDVVFRYVATLEMYPRWMPLVHTAVSLPNPDRLIWQVELRARVGPFARSKNLRMERTSVETDRLVVFERAEADGKNHAAWSLRVELEPDGGQATVVTMHLAYDGRLWSAGLLGAVLDDEIRRGRDGLVHLVSASSKP